MRWTTLCCSIGALCASVPIGASAQGIPRAEIKLDDSFILGVRARVDQEELDEARWATTHAYRPETRQLAQSLLRGHSSAQDAAKRLAARLKVELKIVDDTDLAISQRQPTEAAMRKLRGVKYDQAFLTAVRDEHTNEIARVNGWYGSLVASDSVKAYLHEIMPTLVKHQQSAERLLAATTKTVAIR